MQCHRLIVAVSIFVCVAAYGTGGTEVFRGACSSYKARSLISQSGCSAHTDANAFSATTVLEWDNGNRVVIKESEQGIVVNGKPATLLPDNAECYEVIGTGEVICAALDFTEQPISSRGTPSPTR